MFPTMQNTLAYFIKSVVQKYFIALDLKFKLAWESENRKRPKNYSKICDFFILFWAPPIPGRDAGCRSCKVNRRFLNGPTCVDESFLSVFRIKFHSGTNPIKLLLA